MDNLWSGRTLFVEYLSHSVAETEDIGAQLAASVITSSENVCPRFLPRELGLEIEVQD